MAKLHVMKMTSKYASFYPLIYLVLCLNLCLAQLRGNQLLNRYKGAPNTATQEKYAEVQGKIRLSEGSLSVKNSKTSSLVEQRDTSASSQSGKFFAEENKSLGSSKEHLNVPLRNVVAPEEAVGKKRLVNRILRRNDVSSKKNGAENSLFGTYGREGKNVGSVIVSILDRRTSSETLRLVELANKQLQNRQMAHNPTKQPTRDLRSSTAPVERSTSPHELSASEKREVLSAPTDRSKGATRVPDGSTETKKASNTKTKSEEVQVDAQSQVVVRQGEALSLEEGLSTAETQKHRQSDDYKKDKNRSADSRKSDSQQTNKVESSEPRRDNKSSKTNKVKVKEDAKDKVAAERKLVSSREKDKLDKDKKKKQKQRRTREKHETPKNKTLAVTKKQENHKNRRYVEPLPKIRVRVHSKLKRQLFESMNDRQKKKQKPVKSAGKK